MIRVRVFPSFHVRSKFHRSVIGYRRGGKELHRISQSGSALFGPQSPYSFQYSRAGNMTCATPGISLPTTGACPSGSYSYTYDGNGLRASSTSPNGAISNFTYNLTSAIPQILTDSANAYIYGPSGTPLGNAPLEQISISQPTQSPLYLLSGPSGVTNTFDSQGLVGTQSYDPWGNITSSNNMTTPFGYQGAYTDPTGFQYLINRYYDPSTGQFLSVDPLVQLTGQAYSYAGDNPINFNDPFGLCGCHTGLESILNWNPFSPCNPIRQSVEHGGWWSRHGQLNPAYWAISGYYNEIQCSEAGGGYSCLKYGAEGVGGVAGTMGIAVPGGTLAGLVANRSVDLDLFRFGLKLHYDTDPHPPFGSHLQLNWWQKGVSGPPSAHRWSWPPW